MLKVCMCIIMFMFEVICVYVWSFMMRVICSYGLWRHSWESVSVALPTLTCTDVRDGGAIALQGGVACSVCTGGAVAGAASSSASFGVRVRFSRFGDADCELVSSRTTSASSAALRSA